MAATAKTTGSARKATTARKATGSTTKRPPSATRATTRHSNGTAAGVTNKTGLPKLTKGGLETLVLDHLAAHPRADFTPSDIARVLNRSSGAVANALTKGAGLGKVSQTSEKPRRFRHLGTPTKARATAKR